MNVNKLAQMLEGWTYFFLACNFMLGLYCVILVQLRLRKLRFRREAQQVEFLEAILDHLQAGEYSEIEELCEIYAIPCPGSLPRMSMEEYKLAQVARLDAEIDLLRARRKLEPR